MKFTLCNASQPVVDEKKVRCECIRVVYTYALQ